MTPPRDPGPSPNFVDPMPPDPAATPAGFMVLVPPQDRIHFLDWSDQKESAGPGVFLIHGLATSAAIWAPVARRLGHGRQTIAMDLRGHGLSDAPTEGYDLETLASDTIAAAEGSGLLDGPGARLALVGHGFGALVAVHAARRLGRACAALVLVDGGWEDLGEATGEDADEFLRTLDEPPEVLSSLAAFLADRKAFDPATWDADQEAAARATVVELPAGRVVPATRPHALEACVRSMFTYSPRDLRDVSAPIAIVSAADDEAGTRAAARDRLIDDLVAAGRPRPVHHAFPHHGHNLMRYRPAEIAAIVAAAHEPNASRPAG